MKLDEPTVVPPLARSVGPVRLAARFILKLLTWLVVLAIAAGAGYVYYDRVYLPSTKPVATPPKRPIPVLTSAVRQGDMNLFLNGLGTVTAFNIVTVRSRVDGELTKITFTEGQRVKQGDMLAEIDPRPFEVQLKQNEGLLARDRAIWEIAKSTLEHYQELLKRDAMSQLQVDTQASTVTQAEGTIQTDLALIANSKLQLDYCKITSPITGRIGLRLVDRGNIIHATDLTGLAVVTQLQPIAVIFTIPQDEIARVQQRMKVEKELIVEAYNRDFSIKLATGTLSALDNQVDATTGTVRLKGVFKNEDEMLFPNQFVNIRLLVDAEHDAVIAPAAAIQRGPTFTFAYVLKSDSTVELRKVELGPTEGAEIIVTDGLSPGEIVVTDGLEKLQPGAAVVLRDSAKKSSEPAASTSPGAPADARPPRPKGEQKGS